MKITGTFIDEITHDIPSANWGPQEWARDFDAMKSIGIDTVILIRCGYQDKMTFPSSVLHQHFTMRRVYIDLVDLFLREADRCGMDFFFGLYDSGKYWLEGAYQRELDLNLALATEVVQRYGHYPSFKGWYASHELHVYDEAQVRLTANVAHQLKAIKPLPVLMSPYIKGRKQFADAITPEDHEKQWDEIFAALSGGVDYVAFQDGQVAFSELENFSLINKKLADKYGITPWANIETFERGMPINFLPIDWRNLKMKMDIATRVGVHKLITFEFSHFMSPNSMYPSAHQLFNRYRDFTAHPEKYHLDE